MDVNDSFDVFFRRVFLFYIIGVHGNGLLILMKKQMRDVSACVMCVCVYSFADTDECLEDHRCSHGCRNTEGSYTCTCPRGLSLTPDGSNCRGKKFS